jgi:hypothetical protein
MFSLKLTDSFMCVEKQPEWFGRKLKGKENDRSQKELQGALQVTLDDMYVDYVQCRPNINIPPSTPQWILWTAPVAHPVVSLPRYVHCSMRPSSCGFRPFP